MAPFAATRNRLGADCDCLTSNAKVKLQFCNSTHAKGQLTPDIGHRFYGHPTLSVWFVGEYQKSGKKLDMGKGCVRFKSLDDLALDTRGRRVEVERAKGRGCLTRSVKLAQLVRYCSSSAEAVTIAVGRTVARVSAEEHMANHQAARALMGKGNSELRNSSRARRVRERGQQRKEGRQEVRGEGRNQRSNLATAFSQK